LLRTPTGFSLAPLKDGEVISADDYSKLPEAEQQRLERVMAELRTKLERLFRQVRQWRREHRDKARQLNREVTLFAVGNLMEELKERYTGLEKVLKYLEAVQQDVIENADDFRRKEEGTPGPFGLPMTSRRRFAATSSTSSSTAANLTVPRRYSRIIQPIRICWDASSISRNSACW